jgi:hypothetical protein
VPLPAKGPHETRAPQSHRPRAGPDHDAGAGRAADPGRPTREGTIRSEKGEDGRVYVCVDESPDAVHEHDRGQPDDAGVDLVHELRDRVRFLERELERKDAILLNMTEAMKAIAPPAPRLVQEKPERPVEKPYSAAPPREYAVTPTPQPGRVGPQTEVEAAQEPAEVPEMSEDEQQGRGTVPAAGGPMTEGAERRWRVFLQRWFGG